MSTSTVSALLRAEQAYVAQLADAESLDYGIAFVGRRFKSLADANQFREFVIDDTDALPTTFDVVDRYFAERGATCRVWAPAAGAPIDAVGEFLESRAFDRYCFTAMGVTEWVDLPIPDGVRILPARAMRKALDTVIHERIAKSTGDSSENPADVIDDRLDDPRTDVWVAMANDRCVGYCALFQVGDVARLADVHVSADARGQGVGTALVGQSLRLVRRLMIRTTGVRVLESDKRTIEWLRRCGFTADGTITEFVRSDS